METVRPWCGQPSDRGRLKNGTDIGTQQGRDAVAVHAVAAITVATSFRCRRHSPRQQQTCVLRRL